MLTAVMGYLEFVFVGVCPVNLIAKCQCRHFSYKKQIPLKLHWVRKPFYSPDFNYRSLKEKQTFFLNQQQLSASEN